MKSAQPGVTVPLLGRCALAVQDGSLREFAAPQEAAQAEYTLDVFPGGAADFHSAVVVFVPQDGNVADAVALFFGEDEHFGVEEPGLVFDLRHDLLDHHARDELEAALRVGESSPENHFHENIVELRNHSALE